jgi:hypothetical protein
MYLGTREHPFDKVLPKLRSWQVRILRVLHHLFALAPFLTVLLLYLASWRAESIIGHWPVPSVDDPKYIAQSDWLYINLRLAVMWMLGGACSAACLLPLFTIAMWRVYPRWYSIVLIAVYLVGFYILRIDAGARLTWYMD